MTQEQKAKAYDEALERAKVWQNHLYDTNDKDYADELNYIFPELKESDSEIVRKNIISLVNAHAQGRFKESMLAWLENQGTSYTKKDVDDAYVEGMAFAKDELEKQGKQKSIDWDKQIKYNPNAPSIIEEKPTEWSEEDERAFHHVLSVLEEYGEEHPSKSNFICNWLKSIKARMGGDKV